MKAKISFCVQGHVNQIIYIVKSGWTADRIVEALQSGKIQTTMQENGTIDIVESGDIVARVLSVDNQCEYSEFENVD